MGGTPRNATGSPVARWLLLAVLVLATWFAALPAPAHAFWRSRAADDDVIAVGQLPAEAVTLLQAIREGGPFRWEKDGSVFGNRERLLPRRTRGWYREYTVPTPGASDRGARRIVCGGKPVTQPQACWYSADHYQSFLRIVP